MVSEAGRGQTLETRRAIESSCAEHVSPGDVNVETQPGEAGERGLVQDLEHFTIGRLGKPPWPGPGRRPQGERPQAKTDLGISHGACHLSVAKPGLVRALSGRDDQVRSAVRPPILQPLCRRCQVVEVLQHRAALALEVRVGAQASREFGRCSQRRSLGERVHGGGAGAACGVAERQALAHQVLGHPAQTNGKRASVAAAVGVCGLSHKADGNLDIEGDHHEPHRRFEFGWFGERGDLDRCSGRDPSPDQGARVERRKRERQSARLPAHQGGECMRFIGVDRGGAIPQRHHRPSEAGRRPGRPCLRQDHAVGQVGFSGARRPRIHDRPAQRLVGRGIGAGGCVAFAPGDGAGDG